MDTVSICKATKEAALANLSVATATKNAALRQLQANLLANVEALLAANEEDMQRARERGRGSAFLDRLRLDEGRVSKMAASLDDVIALPDPVGEVVEAYTRPTGLNIRKVRMPLGVVAIIFEARPNVAVEAGALAIKSGNGVVLKGSRESAASVALLARLIRDALAKVGMQPDLVGNVGGGREETAVLLKQKQYIDVIIPRGGNQLKEAVLAGAAMPVIASAGGNCHMYLAAGAPLPMATALVLNAKVQRPSVCNALETVLFDRAWPAGNVHAVLDALAAAGVQLRGDAELAAFHPGVQVVDEDEWYVEYEDMIIKCKFVSGVEEAIRHVNRYGTGHSDAIVTPDDAEWQAFEKGVDAAAVYRNTSTRFTDGFEFGLGAEMGISTQKLHVRGPIGLKELTSVRYVVESDGACRA